MKFLTLAVVLGLQVTSSICAPIDNTLLGATRSLDDTPLAVLQDRAKTSATATSTPTAKQVQQAADNFAGDVATVSNSLNKLGTTTDTTQRKALADAGFKAESDEDAQRSVLFAAGNNNAANTKIVDNTPTVLDGLSSISKDPSDTNTAKQLQTMETARNKNILPSITSLTSSAFKATGIKTAAQTFQPTTGSQQLKAAGSSTSTASNSNTSAASGTSTKGTKAGKNANN